MILQDVNIPDLIKQLDILGDNGVSNELIKGSNYMNLPKEEQEVLARASCKIIASERPCSLKDVAP